MNDIKTVLKIASQRLNLTAYLGRLHLIAVIFASVALIWAILGKMIPVLNLPWTYVGPSLVVAALLSAMILWLRNRQSEVQVAIAVDDRLELREKLATALQVSRRDDAFARAAVEDAINVAKAAKTRESVKRQFPVQPPNRWWIAPLIIAAVVIAASLIPQGNIFQTEDNAKTVALVPREITETFEATVEKIKANEELSKELSEMLDDLDPTKLDPASMDTKEAMRREAIKKLSEVADRIEEIEEEKSKQLEALRKAMKGLKSPAKEGPANELAKALSEGNFEAAKKALEEMMAKAESGEMTPEQQKKLSEQLQNLAKQMAELAQQKKALEEALEKAGLDKSLAQNPQALQQQLQQNQNLTEEQKKQLQQMAQAQQQASQMCQGMAGAMGQMGQGMGQGKMGKGKMGQGAGKMSEMLSDAENLQQMLKQCQGLANNLKSQCQGLGQGLCQNPGNGAFGNAGRGAGGEAPKQPTPTRSKEAKAQGQNGDADIIASTLFDGPLIKGESTARFREVARNVAESHAENVDDEQIPRKYKESIQKYFGEMKSQGTGKADSESETGDSESEDSSDDS